MVMQRLTITGGNIAEINLCVGLLAESIECNVTHVGNAQIVIDVEDHQIMRVQELIPQIFKRMDGRNIT